ncbi:hypothetical protein RJ640_023816 [Escallonia rubra]|uniref:GAG-pre-integrase domain-containing protein n=1 Tax=Escallonia rubra TaxID=112253 RepID=A0AA88RX89_9ASTE|nr:hypothetical protein RJ640_023816 [Escallonia rubra]
MGLLDDYEDRRSSLLNRNPASTFAAALAEMKSEEVRKKTVDILALPSSNQNVLATPIALATSSRPLFRKKWCDFHKWGFHSNDECKRNPKNKNSVPGYNPPRSPSQPAAVVTDTAVSVAPSSSTPTMELTADELAIISNYRLSQTSNSSGIYASSFPSSSTYCVASDAQTGKVVGTGRKVDHLFVLDHLHLPSTSIAAASTSSKALQLWHSRLGHASLSNLRPLVSSGQFGSITHILTSDSNMLHRPIPYTTTSLPTPTLVDAIDPFAPGPDFPSTSASDIALPSPPPAPQGTLSHGLHYPSASSLQLTAYSDVDWGRDLVDRRSTTSFCFLLGSDKSRPVRWEMKTSYANEMLQKTCTRVAVDCLN